MQYRMANNGLFLLLLLWTVSCGAVKERKVLTTPPAYLDARSASLDELLDLINNRYSGVETLTVSKFEVEFTGGSIEDGYFEKYRKAKGYLVAANPGSIFVNILNPLTSSSVLVMAAHQERFQIWIPSRNQFVIGRTDVEADEENPVYNVRPSHILEGMLIEPISADPNLTRFYVEEDQDTAFKYYILGIFRASQNSPVLELERKIWIERSRMEIRRQHYYEGVSLSSVIDYGQSIAVEEKLIPSRVKVERPIERYSIDFEIDPESVRLDRELKADAFSLEKPAGAELVEVENNKSE